MATLMLEETEVGALKMPHALCVAVIVNEPEPTMLTSPVYESTVATAVLLLAYEMDPRLVKLPPKSFNPVLDALV